MRDFNAEKVYNAIRFLDGLGEQKEDSELEKYASQLENNGLITFGQLREYHTLLLNGALTDKEKLIAELEDLVEEEDIDCAGGDLVDSIKSHIKNYILEKNKIATVYEQLKNNLLDEIRHEHGEEVEENLGPLINMVFKKHFNSLA